MTYVLYAAWILAMVLAAGELDSLVAGRLFRRFGLHFPESHWLVSSFLTIMIPGLGQFVNGQPLKALFLILWPFLTLFGSPIPRPWPLLALKTGWVLLPWWLIAVGDAFVVGWIQHRRLVRERKESGQETRASHAVDMYAYLSQRQKRRDSDD